MEYDVVVVGGGIAGITSAAYLAKAGLSVLLCEKTDKLGGLVGTFTYKGFVFDSGIRAIENSGTVFPMLRNLGIDIDFVKSDVSIGIEDKIVHMNSEKWVEEYRELLLHSFPDEDIAINKIINYIKEVIKDMDVLYGIDNPLFLNMKTDGKYMMKKVLPWMGKYLFTIKKIEKMKTPVNKFLGQFTNNSSLIDMVTQHFFKDTPAFFALSYLRMYKDYYYPKGGTGKICDALEEYLIKHNVDINKETTIASIDVGECVAKDLLENKCKYKKLVWAADLRMLYALVNNLEVLGDKKIKEFKNKKNSIEQAKGNGSVFTTYIIVDVDKEYFKDIANEHFFYTPDKRGFTSVIQKWKKGMGKEEVLTWLDEYAMRTTYEISIPSLRDESLAPSGSTGIIISTVFDYKYIERIRALDIYDKAKQRLSKSIIDILSKSIYKGIKDNVIDYFASTPDTLARMFNNSDGAITGWSFVDDAPVEDRFVHIGKSVETPIKNIYQAGHWVFSPSGLPTAIITGKLAADKVIKNLK